MSKAELIGLIWDATKIACTLALTWRGLAVLREMRLELVKRREMNHEVASAAFCYAQRHGARGGTGP